MSYQAIYSLVTRFSLRWSQITPRALRAKSSKGINFLSVAIILLACSAQDAKAQKILTIGSLNTAEQFIDAFEGFKSRMVELGYKEGHNVRYAHHNSKGNADVLRSMAQKLVDDKVDMIITTSTTGTVVAAKATAGTRIPVVFLSAGNPQKLVKNYGTSGSNLAGISSASLELTAKRFELLKELYPRAKRIAMPVDPKGVNYQSIVAEIQESTPRLGYAVSEVHVLSVADVAKVAPSITRKNYDGIFMPADSLVSEGIKAWVRQSIKEKLPLVTSLLVNVKRGCLLTYASDYTALGKQGAVLADKILKGAKAADLPIELPDKIFLALNLKTAKAIGLRIPKEILLRTDETFE
ncbi:MAG TPA: ABC transporter substrate-binding protein [Candidatus Binatia bacterium]|nr:ABC transporter substrate-binding protein [Candidatus Binatia bacterium]